MSHRFDQIFKYVKDVVSLNAVDRLVISAENRQLPAVVSLTEKEYNDFLNHLRNETDRYSDLFLIFEQHNAMWKTTNLYLALLIRLEGFVKQ